MSNPLQVEVGVEVDATGIGSGRDAGAGRM